MFGGRKKARCLRQEKKRFVLLPCLNDGVTRSGDSLHPRLFRVKLNLARTTREQNRVGRAATNERIVNRSSLRYMRARECTGRAYHGLDVV